MKVLVKPKLTRPSRSWSTRETYELTSASRLCRNRRCESRRLAYARSLPLPLARRTRSRWRRSAAVHFSRSVMSPATGDICAKARRSAVGHAVQLATPSARRTRALGSREPLEDGDGRAIRPVRCDLRLLGVQHTQHVRIAGPEAETMVEVERPRAQRLCALVAELVAVHGDRPHPEDAPVRAEQFGREGRRLALAERREDVDGEVERAEELQAAAVGHRDPVLEGEESVVALEREAEARLDPDEGEPYAAVPVSQEDVVGIRMREGVELA